MIEAENRRRQAVVLGLAMIVSVWFHILGLALWRYIPPEPAEPAAPPILLEIEIPALAPEPSPGSEQTPAAKSSPTPAVMAARALAGPESPDPSPEEDIISLESKAPEYLSYLGRVKAGIARHWIFPPAARENRETGSLTAVFTLDRAGKLLKIVVEKSSGHPALDQSALEALRGAVPFPPFPEHIKLKRLNIRVYFDYRIRYLTVK
ncbi:MAG: TonB family protein [Thermodesulfobacteriota bacterium]|nr:TonB family protein [Thermodesulfobacteriota bacterium]